MSDEPATNVRDVQQQVVCSQVYIYAIRYALSQSAC